MFRFTIRELVLLTLVVALAVAWWLDRSQLAPDAQNWRERNQMWERAADEWRRQGKGPLIF
jgi:hypothetical protein